MQPSAFSATFLDGSGTAAWQDLGIATAAVDGAGTTVTLDLTTAPGTGLLRLIVRGTGPTPLTGTGPAWLPLGGSSSNLVGQDFIWTKEVA
jgi:hypothetical protein